MRSLRALLAGLVGALAMVVLSPAPSYACSCVTADPAEHLRYADVVMVATFDDRDEPLLGTRSSDPATYTLTVHRVLTGDAGTTEEVLTPMSGASCGLEGVELGERYVVFAAYHDLMGEPSERLWSLLCSGNAKASPAFVAEVEAITGPGAPPRPGAPVDAPAASAAWALPTALAGVGALTLLTGALWLRVRRSP